jgi:hypothetical protein
MAARQSGRWGVLAAIVVTLAMVAGVGGASAQEGAPKGAAAAGETRTWTDITGKFSREAEFLKLEDGQVHLRLKGGKETKIPLKELSKKDRDWVRNSAAAAGPTKPVGTRVVLRSYKTIVDDTVILSQLFRQQALAGLIPGLFVQLTGGKPLDGFDIAKPIVITMHVDQQGLSGVVVAVPVLEKQRFQKTLDAVFPRTSTPAGRGYEIGMIGKTVYAKPGEKYFLLSDDNALIRNAAADPPAPVVVADVSVESFNGAVSEAARQAAVAQVETMLAAAPVPADLPPAAERSRKETMEVVRSLMRSMAIDADRATFEASLDPTTQGLSAAYTVRARSDTPMAEALATYGAIRPRFVAAGGEADAAWVGVSLPMNAWLRMAIEETLGGGVNGMKSELSKLQGNPDYPKAEAALAELESVYRRLTAMDHFEQEMVIAADETGTPRFVWRIAFAEARALVAAFAKLLAVGSPPGTIAPDADGILELPGTYPARLAATDEALIIGLRCADGAPVKAVLDARPGGSGVPPVSVRIDLADLWPIMVQGDTTGMLAGINPEFTEGGKCRADVSSLADGIELRVNADKGVLGMLGSMVATQAAAALNAQPGGPAGGAPQGGLLPQSIQGFPIPPVTPPGPPQPPAP